MQSSNDDKRLQALDKITTYPHRTNVFKIYESELMKKKYVKCQFYDEIVL